MANTADNYFSLLKDKIIKKEATVTVMGMGRIGMPLAVHIASAGFKVYGFDPNPEVLKKIQKLDVKEYTDVAVTKALLASKKLIVGNSHDTIKRSDVVVICVPTPLRERRELDISYIESAGQIIRENMKTPVLVILESTTYPGTTEEVLKPILEKGDIKVGKNLFLAHAPERLDPGNKIYHIGNTTKLVGGVTKKCTDLTVKFYKTFVSKVHKMSSARNAEMAKIFENVFRSVNIALVNEFVQICARMGLDAHDVLEGAGTKEFGFMSFKPGPGVGGHCIPLDPYYFLWKSHEFDVHPRFIQLALEINENMPYYVVDRLADEFNKRGKCLKGSKLLLLGMAYKAGVSDLRESPALKVFELLEKRGAKVYFHDNYCPKVKIGNSIKQSVSLSPATLQKMDAVIIITAHPDVNYDMVTENSALIMDTRYVLKGKRLKAGKVVWL